MDDNTPKDKPLERGEYPDFFGIIRFDKMIGVRQVNMIDGTGERCECILIPAVKNGIVREGRFHWRLILQAQKMKTSPVPYVTHALAPCIDQYQERYMKTKGYDTKMAIVGDIVKDIKLIKYLPREDVRDVKDMERSTKAVMLERRGKTFEEFTGQKYHSVGTAWEQHVESLQQQSAKSRLRDRLFKLKGNADDMQESTDEG